MASRALTTRVFLAALLIGGIVAVGESGVSAVLPELVFLQEAEAPSLDNLLDFSVAGLGIHAHIYDPLVDMEGPDFRLTPKLAESWQIVNPTTWRFKLRRGVRFHNGQELTAEDVLFTIETAKGARSRKRGLVGTIDAVSALDKHTIEITTKQADAALLSRLGFLYIVNKAAYEKEPDAYGRSPIGTGRYRVVRWEKDQQLVLEAFDQYWGDKATVARLIVRPVKEATARIAELQTGRAHVIKGVPVEMAKELGQREGVKVVVAKGVRQVYYRFNATKAPFNDPRVRQAANYAIDREAIVTHILEGYGEVRGGMFSPRQRGYDPAVPGYRYDPDRARQLLREAGHAGGVDATWNIVPPAVVKGLEIAEAAANQLRQVGIRVRLNSLESGKHFDEYRAGNYDLMQTTWSLQADPDSIISGFAMCGELSLKIWFKDEKVCGLIDETRRTLDPSRRLVVYHHLYRALVEFAPFLFIHAQDEIFGVRKDVNWTVYPFGGNAGMVYFVPMK